MSESAITKPHQLVEPGREKEFLHLLLKHLPVSVSILDGDLNYRMISKRTYDSLRISPDDLSIGSPLAICHDLMMQNGMLTEELVERNSLSSQDLAKQTKKSEESVSNLIELGDGTVHRLMRKPIGDNHTLSIATDVTELVEKEGLLDEDRKSVV